MYEAYWGLSRSPFLDSADGCCYFESVTHREAYSRLLFLIEEKRRCGTLTGQVGTGKSLLLRNIRRLICRTQRLMVSVDMRGLDSHRFLFELAAALRLGPEETESSARLWRNVEDYLCGWRYAGQQSVFLFDHLDRAASDCAGVIERLMHLADDPSSRTTFLIASRRLDDHLPLSLFVDAADLRIELAPLDRAETARYLQSLLAEAGCPRGLFEEEAFDELFAQSGGVPRDLNRLADLSLLAAMGQRRETINETIVRTAAGELRASAVSDNGLPVLYESA